MDKDNNFIWLVYCIQWSIDEGVQILPAPDHFLDTHKGQLSLAPWNPLPSSSFRDGYLPLSFRKEKEVGDVRVPEELEGVTYFHLDT